MDYSIWSVLEAKECGNLTAQGTLWSPLSGEEAFQKAWDELDAPYLRAAADAFPKRLKACVDADGYIIDSQCSL